MKLKVLVSGGAGFIGSALVRELEKVGATVVVFDNMVAGTKDHLEDCKCQIIKGDILNQAFLEYIMVEEEIEYVFHLAAEPFIPRGFMEPEKFFMINTLGTLKVLQACHSSGIKKVVHYSTSEVYGTAQYLPMDEKHPTLPHSHYAISKLAGDRIAYVSFKKLNLPVVILRQFNCYGPRESQPYIIPEIISQLFRTNILKLGNLEAKRDFTYVHDAAKGAIALMLNPDTSGETINLGFGKNYSIEELVFKIARIMGKEDIKITLEKSRLRPYDVDELLCDSSKAQGFIKWNPETDIDKGLIQTIEWFKEKKKWSWEN